MTEANESEVNETTAAKIASELEELWHATDRLYAIESLLELAVSDKEHFRADQVRAARHFLSKELEDMSNIHARIRGYIGKERAA